MPKASRTSHAILGFLTWEPMSGYAIKKAVAASIDNFWNESYGQIYPILKRLVANGLATRSPTAWRPGRRVRAEAGASTPTPSPTSAGAPCATG